jgi:hypothetical protein
MRKESSGTILLTNASRKLWVSALETETFPNTTAKEFPVISAFSCVSNTWSDRYMPLSHSWPVSCGIPCSKENPVRSQDPPCDCCSHLTPLSLPISATCHGARDAAVRSPSFACRCLCEYAHWHAGQRRVHQQLARLLRARDPG